MKKFTLLTLAVALFLSACKKDDDKNTPPPGTNVCPYAPYSTGSIFNFSSSQGNYTFEVLGDTTINGEFYKKTKTSSGSQTSYSFYSCANGIHKQLIVSGTTQSGVPVYDFELIHLKVNEPVGTSWSVSQNFSGVQTTYTLIIDEKGISKTINGVTYTNVISVNMVTTAQFGGQFYTTNDDYYWYAEDAGFIGSTFINTQLLSYNIVQ